MVVVEAPKGDEPPKAGVLEAPKMLLELAGAPKAKPPNAGCEAGAPKAGVLAAPNAGVLAALPPKLKGELAAGWDAAPNRPPPVAGALAPKPPKAGVLVGVEVPKPPPKGDGLAAAPKAGVELPPNGDAALACPNTLPVVLAPKPGLLLAAAPNPNPVGVGVAPGAAPKAGAAAGAGAALWFFTPAT